MSRQTPLTLTLLSLMAVQATQAAPAADADSPPPASTPASTPEVAQLPAIEVISTLGPRAILDAPASISQLNESDLYTGRPALKLSEGLASVPGIQVQDRNNSAQDLQISIRGFGARSTFGVRGVRIYVDGIPATMPDGQAQLSNIDLTSASTVEVLRGPYSALYGNSSGGVLMVETAKGSGTLRPAASLTTGSYGLRRYGLQAGAATEASVGLTHYNVSASRQTLDGWRDHSEMSKNQGNARLDFAFADDSRLSLLAGYALIHADDPLGLTAEDVENDARGVTPNALKFNTRKSTRQSQIGLRYEKSLSTDTQLQAMVYAGERRTVQYQAIPPATQKPATHAGGVIDLERGFAGIDLRATHQASLLGQPLSVTIGGAYDHMSEDRRGYENFQGSATAPTDLGTRGELRRKERNTLRDMDVYLQAGWDISDRWLLEGGLRRSEVRFRSRDRYLENGDDSGKSSYSAWLPVFAARYALGADSSLYASFGKGFETPTFNEISYRPDGSGGLNLALRPSTSRNYEIGAKTGSLGGLLTAALFRIDTQDEIVSAGSSGGRATFRNAGKTRRNGAELSWQAFLVQDLQFTLSYTYLDAAFRHSGQGSDGKRIPGVARHNGYAGLRWMPEQGWQAGAEWRAMGNIEANTANSAHAPGYAVAALYTGYRITRNAWDLDLLARVDNLFDKRYIGSVIVNESNSRYYEPAAGRNWTFMINAGYRFQ
ncbi:TonB-dependent receptor family protein [Kerstersia gyiorum]|uniref:TonB-dependent receptor family protein n=1 Tax=Kerstersia gyiorum TaxID=206506 RepID=UPI00242F1A2E|nr:TonB-dependent receptor [Kerstersia gyiorum]MCH4270999.1 TonB-dependent receptor [Kerstersia gyiorum]MCI1229990.1 TonB-dependent receptor [Kerstersia gyiorum]